MTNSDQTDSRLTQLTIDGGEVSHPPPAPRVTCPECEKTVTLTRPGFYHKHSNGWAQECPASGQRYRGGITG